MVDDLSDITILVNGELRNCPHGVLLPELLDLLKLHPKLIAIEYNGEILHRQYWNNTVIQASDRLEIVTIVGGG